MSEKYGTSVWFDIPTKSLNKSSGFYGELFGWKFQPMNEGYHLIEIEGEHIGGLVLESEPISNSLGPVIYLKVKSIEDAAAKIKSLGGQLEGEKVSIGEAEGSFQHFRDLEGNRLSLWCPGE